MKNNGIYLLWFVFLVTVFPCSVKGQVGYDMWLNYQTVDDSERVQEYRALLSDIYLVGGSKTIDAAKAELNDGLGKLLGEMPNFLNSIPKAGVVAGTIHNSDWLRNLDLDLARLGPEGYLIREIDTDGQSKIIIAANRDIGVLYGVFDLLRRVQTHQNLDDISIERSPKVEYRMVNHWDNLDRLVERGYAGLSLWEWGTLPQYKHPRYTDYARFNASIGINASVINNVNADPEILTDQFLKKVKVLADVFRPYGIQMFLSINFQSPQRIGGLDSSDPLDPFVAQWWS